MGFSENTEPKQQRLFLWGLPSIYFSWLTEMVKNAQACQTIIQLLEKYLKSSPLAYPFLGNEGERHPSRNRIQDKRKNIHSNGWAPSCDDYHQKGSQFTWTREITQDCTCLFFIYLWSD